MAASYIVPGLEPGSNYSINIKAVDASGKSTMYDSTLKLTTKSSYDTGAPAWSKESKVSAQAITQTSVKLSWTAASDDKGVIGYRVYQNGKPIEGDITFTPINTADTLNGTYYRVEGLFVEYYLYVQNRSGRCSR